MPIISGGSSGGGASTSLYSSLLAAPAASIDTGANGIAQTANHLLVVVAARGTQAATTQVGSLYLNNDASASYDAVNVQGQSTGASGSAAASQAGYPVSYPGTTGDASNFCSLFALIPNYTQAQDHTILVCYGRAPVSATLTTYAGQWAWLNYRSTTAITRVTLSGGGNNLAAGSIMTVYGLV